MKIFNIIKGIIGLLYKKKENFTKAKTCCVYGIYYRNQGIFNSAINWYNKAIELCPNYAVFYYNRGIANYYKKNYYEALNDFNNAIVLNPKYDKAYNNRGVIKDFILERVEAHKDFTKAITLNPKKIYYDNRKFIENRYDFLEIENEDFGLNL